MKRAVLDVQGGSIDAGGVQDIFQDALSRYGVWPTTIWRFSASDPNVRRLKEVIGDVGSSRVLKAGGQSYGLS